MKLEEVLREGACTLPLLLLVTQVFGNFKGSFSFINISRDKCYKLLIAFGILKFYRYQAIKVSNLFQLSLSSAHFLILKA